MDNPVLALAVDGNTLYLGGNFTRWRGVNNSAINLARVNATDGTQDTTFSPVGVGLNGTDGQVAALALSGSSLFVGGRFSGYRGVANSARGIAKLDKLTGALDTTFSPPANNGFIGFPQVYALATTQDSIYVGGLFLGYRGVMGAGRNLAKLSLADGALDTTFSPPSVSGFDREVRALKVVGSTLLVGGAFTDYRGAPRSAPGLAALELTTGALSASFRASPTDAPGVSREPGAQAAVHALVVDGSRLWVGGSFAHYGGKQVDGLARFRDDTGRVDLTFSPPSAEGLRDGASSAQVTALAAHGGSLLVGGSFTSYRGVANSARRLARLNQTTGALDTAFSPPGANGFDSDVYALAVSGDALFVGGDFSAYRGVAGSANALARLDAVSGAIDTTFSPPGATANGFDSSVYALAVNGGALFVGGDFTTRYGAAMVPAARLAKLDAVTGAVDATFTMAGSGADDTVRALAVSGSGLFVGGDFTTYRGAPAPRLMKLDLSTGARVAAFGVGGFDQTVYGLAAVGDAVFVAGHFTAYRGVPASASFVARLDGASGALDTTFTPSGAPSGAPFSMYVVAPYLDALFVGGRFSFCDSNGCVQNSTRVNQQTRAIQ
ncbi:MAG: delta-60 repeat domain-containing protein [Myxococcus sp.]|nr:delta-60 repeat domain-containing protein [Myxococcus sp.]